MADYEETQKNINEANEYIAKAVALIEKMDAEDTTGLMNDNAKLMLPKLSYIKSVLDLSFDFMECQKKKEQMWGNDQPEGGVKETPKLADRKQSRFEVGKTYVCNHDHGKSTYEIVKRNENTDYVTIRQVYKDNGKVTYGDIIVRKVDVKSNPDVESISVSKGSFGRVCWYGIKTLYASDVE